LLALRAPVRGSEPEAGKGTEDFAQGSQP
jgi:hypothetical protein